MSGEIGWSGQPRGPRIPVMRNPSNQESGAAAIAGNVRPRSGPWKPSPLRLAIRVVWRYALLLAGALVFVIAVRGLILPNRILSGGVTGMALLLNRLTAFPLGLAMALLNVPIFLLGVRYVGRAFAIRSAIAVIASWLLADYAPIPAWTHDPLLAGVFGGLLAGVGTALAMKAGGSLGGFDILGVVVNRRFGLGVGEVLLALNGILVVVSGLIGTPELAMYTLVAIYAAGKTIDSLQSPRGRKAFLIMTRRPDPIRDRVLKQMNRGITVLRAEGAWSREEITALLCVVTRAELRELGDIVQEEDTDAFVVVLESSEVMGSFRNPTAAAYWRRLQEANPRGTAGR
jgi:uncharacterized membrane-anchored protein YitT (DUF2179 family)